LVSVRDFDGPTDSQSLSIAGTWLINAMRRLSMWSPTRALNRILRFSIPATVARSTVEFHGVG